MSKGPKVFPIVEQLIASLVRDMPDTTYAREIRARTAKALEPLAYPVPGLRKVQEIATRVRRAGKSVLDRPWSIGAQPERFTPEELDFLIDLASHTWHLGRHFALREAIWTCRLRHIAQRLWPDNMPLAALAEGQVYAMREASAEALGQSVDTMDLDAELAFNPWESPKKRWLYEEAIKIGHLPPSKRILFEPLTRGGWGKEEPQPHAVIVEFLPEDFGPEDVQPDEDWSNLNLSTEAKKMVAMMMMEVMIDPEWLNLSHQEQRDRFHQLVTWVEKQEAQIDAEGGKR